MTLSATNEGALSMQEAEGEGGESRSRLDGFQMPSNAARNEITQECTAQN